MWVANLTLAGSLLTASLCGTQNLWVETPIICSGLHRLRTDIRGAGIGATYPSGFVLWQKVLMFLYVHELPPALSRPVARKTQKKTPSCGAWRLKLRHGATKHGWKDHAQVFCKLLHMGGEFFSLGSFVLHRKLFALTLFLVGWAKG